MFMTKKFTDWSILFSNYLCPVFFYSFSLYNTACTKSGKKNWLIGENKNVDNVGILHFCHVGLQDTQKNAKKRG